MISAIIVLYHPNEKLLSRLISSVSEQVGQVYVVDNTATGQVDWLHDEWFFVFGDKVKYLPLMSNKGIATAQNKGIDAAISDGYKEFVLFDQDSYPPAGLIEKLLQAKKMLQLTGNRIGAIGPLFQDEKDGRYCEAVRHYNCKLQRIKISPEDSCPIESDYIIASGSIIDIESLKVVGYMNDDLFIDWVDIEWGIRAKNKGYKNFIVPNAIMKHSIGDDVVEFAGKSISLHSDIRNYYIVRNGCYLLKSSFMPFSWKFVTFFRIPQYLIIYPILSKNKISSLRLLIKACFDGFRSKLGRAF